MERKEEKVIVIKPIRKTKAKIKIFGDTPLILNKKARSFEREQIFMQSHKKGTTLPNEINTKLHYCLWEKLITSITWENPIEEFDDYEDYTEEMYEELLQTNRPCILSKAFMSSFYETFVSFGYKEATGRAGTDFKRSVKIQDWKNPISFANATYSQHLTPNTGISKTNVLAQHTIFDGWACDLTVTFCESIFPADTILEIINNTGEFIGIGTKRAEGFGNYHIDNVNFFE